MRIKVVALVLALVLGLAVPTAAVTATEDDAGAVTLSPHSGPNGQYASVSGGELAVEFGALNDEAVTTADNVFNVTADTDCAARVWVEIENVTAYRGDERSNPVDSEANAAIIAPNDTLQVGLAVDTRGTTPNPGSMTVHAEETAACGGSSSNPTDPTTTPTSTDDTTTTTPNGTDESEFAVEVSVENGSDAGERVITVAATNTGEAEGTFVAEPEVDGTPVGSKAATLFPGETRELTFTWRPDEEGTYTLTVGGKTVMVDVATPNGPAPAFRVTALEPDDDEVAVGSTTRVVATVENTGDAAGTYTAVLTDNGTVVAEREVEVPAGERRDVTFEVSFDEGGEHELAVGDRSATVAVTGDRLVQIRDAAVQDDRVTPGNATTIAVTLENTGDVDGERELALRIAGVTVDTVTVSVPAGETRTVALGWTFDTPGIYSVGVSGVDAGEVTVQAGDSTTNRLLTSGLQVIAGVPLLVGLLLALWRREDIAALARSA